LCLSFASAETVVIDDEDGAPGFTTTGDDWTTWATNGYGFDGGDSSYHYTSHTVGGSDRRGTATWTPTISTAGLYRVETHFRRTENRTHDADHYLYGADGSVEHISVDQRGDGASGWLELGEMQCDSGFGSCWVTLDANDDDESDEANAVRFVLVEPGDVEVPELDCSDEVGSHSIDLWASVADADGWSSSSSATGEADGSEAHSENVDAGEYLRAWGFGGCSEGTITGVELGVLSHTQYDSGTYELDLSLSAGGSASTTFGSTNSSWTTVDLSGDRAWTWGDVSATEATVTLHDHPGGQRDSDAWVDAFRLRVTYVIEDTTVPEDTGESIEEPEDTGLEDDIGPEDEEDDGDERLPKDLSEAENEDVGGCSTVPVVGGWLAILALGLTRRRTR